MRRSGMKAYSDFVSDDEGTLRRYLFDVNVRGELSQSQANADILTMLPHGENPRAKERVVR
jgi:hypothetical protein